MLTAAQIQEIKSKLDTEMNRRMNSKSISDVTLTNPAFTTVPALNEPIRAEHGTKTLGVMTQISDVGDIAKGSGAQAVNGKIPKEFDYTTMKQFIESLASKSATASSGQTNTGCTSSCTGLCAGNCYSMCTGNFSGSFSGNSFSGSFSGDFFSGDFSGNRPVFSANGFSGDFSGNRPVPPFSSCTSCGGCDGCGGGCGVGSTSGCSGCSAACRVSCSGSSS